MAACCLPTFVDNYRPVDPFTTYINTSATSGDLTVCNASGPTSGIAPPSNFLPDTDYMQACSFDSWRCFAPVLCSWLSPGFVDVPVY